MSFLQVCNRSGLFWSILDFWVWIGFWKTIFFDWTLVEFLFKVLLKIFKKHNKYISHEDWKPNWLLLFCWKKSSWVLWKRRTSSPVSSRSCSDSKPELFRKETKRNVDGSRWARGFWLTRRCRGGNVWYFWLWYLIYLAVFGLNLLMQIYAVMIGWWFLAWICCPFFHLQYLCSSLPILYKHIISRTCVWHDWTYWSRVWIWLAFKSGPKYAQKFSKEFVLDIFWYQLCCEARILNGTHSPMVLHPGQLEMGPLL